VTATPNGADDTVPAADTNGWRVVVAVTEAASAGAAAAAVVQRGAERVTTPNPAGLTGETVCAAALPGGLAVWLAQAVLAAVTASATINGCAARLQLIMANGVKRSGCQTSSIF